MDYSVDVENLKRPEVLAQLKQYNISLSGRHSTKQLKNTLQNQMKKIHPIHSYLTSLSNQDIKAIANHLKIRVDTYQHKRIRAKIAKYFFAHNAKEPVLALKNLLENKCPKNEDELTQKPINTGRGGTEKSSSDMGEDLITESINAEQGEIENVITSHNNSRYDDWEAWQNNFDRRWNRAFQHIK